MSKLLQCHLCLFIGIVSSLSTILAQNIPPIACPNYFQYLNYNNQYIGKITLPSIGSSIIKLNAKFSQRVPVQSNYYGTLSLFQDQRTTINNIKNGYPLSYRVDFPINNVLPKLTRITVNDVDICYDNDYPPPSTMLSLEHRLETSTKTITSPLFSTRGGVFEIPFLGGNEAATIQVPTFSQPATSLGSGPAIFQNQNVGFESNVNNPFLNKPMPNRPTLATIPTIDVRQQILLQPQNTTKSMCGHEVQNTIQPFVHGGTSLMRGQFPWLAAIFRRQTGDTTFLCGGSLVSSRTVVTAGHCFKLLGLTADKIVVYLGRHDLDNLNESGVVACYVKNLLIHPDYNPRKYPDADLAILHFDAPVSFTQYIAPICLWNELSDPMLIVGQKGFVAGWGKDQKGNSVSPVPKFVDSKIVSENQCIHSLPHFKDLTSSRTLCAGNQDGTGPCIGDSGGGLMLLRNERWVLRGIVSVGQTVRMQCNLNEFVVYCDVAMHIEWVRTNILD